MSIDISSYKPNRGKKETPRRKIDTSFLDIELNTSFTNKNRAVFYKEFSSLLDSGVGFRRALEILKEQQKKKAHKDLIANLSYNVIKGKSLYEALKESEKFSPYEYFSIKIGEETRKLDHVLENLSKFFERKMKMRRQIISVITYPIFVLMLTLGVLYFMMKYVVPMFSNVFKQFDKELPKLTKKIIFISENFTTIIIIFFLVQGLLFLFHFYFRKSKKYRGYLSLVILKIPMIGRLVQKVYLARFCQSLSLLLSAKTPLIVALDLVQKMISFYPLEKSLKVVKEDVSKGALFSISLSKHSIYDYKLVSMISVAEQINKLDEMFERLAKQYDEETEHLTKMLGVLMEPLIILIIGCIVAVVLIAMYMPMFDLSKILQS